jgi:hypothetical protein
MGDVHGDLRATLRALQLARVIGEQGQWIGGNTILVQTGDILDRGDDEFAIMQLFQRLKIEARSNGGEVHVLNGNHELMNSYWDFRYVTDGGWKDFEEVATVDPKDTLLAALDPAHRARAAAFRPGGPAAVFQADNPIAEIVGNSLFVHGGVLPEHLKLGIRRMNQEVRAWLMGHAPEPDWIRGKRSPVWTRLYSAAPDSAACDTLNIVLSKLGLERMVVGHTVQSSGITSYCGGKVWCIDVGMAAHYGGGIEVLEIRGDVARRLRRDEEFPNGGGQIRGPNP